MDVVAIVQALNLLIDAASKVGVSMAKINAMREENGGEKLSNEQIQELLADAEDRIRNM